MGWVHSPCPHDNLPRLPFQVRKQRYFDCPGLQAILEEARFSHMDLVAVTASAIGLLGTAIKAFRKNPSLKRWERRLQADRA